MKYVKAIKKLEILVTPDDGKCLWVYTPDGTPVFVYDIQFVEQAK